MIVLNPRRVTDKLDQETVDITTNSSSVRLMVGGRARLVRLARSRQAAVSGRMVCNPRAQFADIFKCEQLRHCGRRP